MTVKCTSKAALLSEKENGNVLSQLKMGYSVDRDHNDLLIGHEN